nr:hypothetical protein [uncultured Campylobacter sp.]
MGLFNGSGGFILTGKKRKNKKSTDEYRGKRLASTAIARPSSKSNLTTIPHRFNNSAFIAAQICSVY